MKVIKIFDRYKKQEESINPYVIWKFAPYNGGKRTELFFIDKAGSVVIDTPYEEFARLFDEIEPPSDSIIK